MTDQLQNRVWRICHTCQDYLDHGTKRKVLSDELALKAFRDGLKAEDVVDEFMLAAHKRHMDGYPLREDGPTRMTDPYLGRMAALLSPGLFGPTEDDT